jgi:hypothetical protein
MHKIQAWNNNSSCTKQRFFFVASAGKTSKRALGCLLIARKIGYSSQHFPLPLLETKIQRGELLARSLSLFAVYEISEDSTFSPCRDVC